MNKLESKFQRELKEELELTLKGCIVLIKPGYTITGFPDLLILYKNQWVALECKRSIDSDYQPGQEWWIGELGTMTFSAMICPENRKEILDEVFLSFGVSR